jgi:hypothetical protein
MPSAAATLFNSAGGQNAEGRAATGAQQPHRDDHLRPVARHMLGHPRPIVVVTDVDHPATQPMPPRSIESFRRPGPGGGHPRARVQNQRDLGGSALAPRRRRLWLPALLLARDSRCATSRATGTSRAWSVHPSACPGITASPRYHPDITPIPLPLETRKSSARNASW